LTDVRIGAICDVDRSHADRALGIVHGERQQKPPVFSDFRRVLDLKNIDAVAIVTPDHWHAIPTVSAFEAGKDVFVEKPLSYSVTEGRAMADASLNHKRVSQMGNHIHNDYSNYRRVVEIVKSGKLGKITRVHAWKTSPIRNFKPRNPATLPETLDYDFLAGTCSEASISPASIARQLSPLLGLLGWELHRLLVPHQRCCVLGNGLPGTREDIRGRRAVLPHR
jgi:hypothetical protein